MPTSQHIPWRAALAIVAVTLLPGLGLYATSQRLLGWLIWLWLGMGLLLAFSNHQGAANLCAQALLIQVLSLKFSLRRTDNFGS